MDLLVACQNDPVRPAQLQALSNRVLTLVPMRSARQAVQYHDYVGPTVLCGILLVAVIVNFSLRLKQGF